MDPVAYQRAQLQTRRTFLKQTGALGIGSLALAAYAHVDGVEEAPPEAEDLHALDAPHGVNEPSEQQR